MDKIYRKQNMYYKTQSLKKYDRIVVFDLETSGLNPKDDRIIQIAAIRLVKNGDKWEQEATLSKKINPEKKISEKIISITGITNEELQQECREKEVFPEIMDFFGTAPVCMGYNICAFDIAFMKELYRRNNNIFLSKLDLDVFQMVRDFIPYKDLKKFTLEKVTNYYGLDAGLRFHDAMDDVRATLRLFTFFQKSYEKDDYLQKGTLIPRITNHFPWAGKRHDLQRIYFCTDYGKIYFDIFSHSWGSKEIDMNTVDVSAFADNAYKISGEYITNDDAFYQWARLYVAKWSKKQKS